ncbi:hypothetical protein [Salinimicrobium soli]|uniref:hypothetical protein n=1 Tax=Salinimicrobium soli TaxID=1254399 RepID=UPI003AAFEEFA
MTKKYIFLLLPLVLSISLGLMTFLGDITYQNEDSKKQVLVSKEVPLMSKAEPGILREDTNVLLRVDTENITEENYDETVEMSDDRSNPSEVSRKPSEHVALVDKNMKIYWRAEPLDPQLGVTVDVLGIFRKTEGGAEILENVFRDPNQDGIVMGKIKNKNIDGLEYYNILIRVNGETPETYLIDPKLKMSN